MNEKKKFRVTLIVENREHNEVFCEMYQTYAIDYADAEERAIDWARCRFSTSLGYEISIKSSYEG